MRQDERLAAAKAAGEPMRCRLFGLTVEFAPSCHCLSDLRDLSCWREEAGTRQPDVRVSCDEDSDFWRGLPAVGPGFHAVDGGMLLHVRGVARYVVRRGSEILVDPAQGTSPELVSVFLFGSALGALLHQRGSLPLHASAIVLPGQTCAVFLGRSGAGKSTLAVALARRGYQVIADDITVVTMEGDDSPRVQPGLRRAKLCEDSAATLGIRVAEPDRVCPGGSKYRVPLGHRVGSSESLEIRQVMALKTGDRNGLEKPMAGPERVLTLLQNTYRPHFLRFGVRSAHFRLCTAVSERAVFGSLTRSQELSRLDELADIVERELAATGAIASRRVGQDTAEVHS